MLYKRLIASALVFGAAATAPPLAEAQMICGPRTLLVERLAESYGESQKGLGLRGPGALYELWTSEKGTWTVLLTRPNGVSCMVADGHDWHEAPLPETGDLGEAS